jgi:hypothetical protein
MTCFLCDLRYATIELFSVLSVPRLYNTNPLEPKESPQEETTGKTGRPPPIVITATVNLLQLQKLIKSVVKENLSSETPGTEPGLSQKPWGILLQSSST